MSKYTLFEKTVIFSPAEERYQKIRMIIVEAYDAAGGKFEKWYALRLNIKNVLEQYENFSDRLIVESLADRLYDEITSCGIYDISKETVISKCMYTRYRAEAIEPVEDRYLSILSKQEGEEAYRRARKASRGRWQGGGFGLGGAIKGAMQAGAMNAASGLGHSLFNAVGNAGSAAVAMISKTDLYASEAVVELLKEGVKNDLVAFGYAVIQLIKKSSPGSIDTNFDVAKAEALFDNAKRIPDKRGELLVQAFQKNPTGKEIISYIFTHYPEERKEIYRAAKHFKVDVSAAVEEVFGKEYTEAAQKSEDLAREARTRILELMQEYEITECKTLDRLETDCLTRLCKGYESADEAACKAILSAVKKYEAAAKNKEPFVTKLGQRIDKLEVESLEELCKGYESADEATCNTLVEAVNKAKKRAANKKVLLEKLQARIEEIWSAEDGEIFDNLYLKTDITNVDARNEAIQYVKEKGRTSSSEKYIKALEGCTDKNIELAQVYWEGKKSRIYNTIALSGAAAWLINLIWITAGFLPAAIILGAAVFCGYKSYNLSQAWKLLSVDGAVRHPTITKGVKERAKGIHFIVLSIPGTAVLVGLLFIIRAIFSPL